MPPRRILLATFGSLGDLHPFLALATGLRARGHHVTLASHARYREKAEAQGVAFHPVRPDFAAFGDEQQAMRRAMHPRSGAEHLIREMFLRHLRDTHADLAAAGPFDLAISHPLTFALPLLAEHRRVPWLSVALAPLSFFSAHDLPIMPPAPRLSGLICALGPRVAAPLIRAMQRSVAHWTEPVRALRRELCLPPLAADPLFAGQFSPHGTLALFPALFGPPQPDWPPRVTPTGFLLHDHSALDPVLAAFLDSGPPPLVFTLGSAVVRDPGNFYRESLAAALALRHRAILLTGPDPASRPSGPLPSSIHLQDYAPYSALFPRAAAIIHQGGVGTTAQTLRSGRPALIVPHAFDQPDNAARAARLGAALILPPAAYTARSAARHLARLLRQPSFAARASAIAQTIQSLPDPLATACDAVEQALAPQ